MPPHGGLNCTVSSWRTICLLVEIWMPPHGGLNCTVSSWRTICLLVEIWMPPRCLLVENYCLLVENFTFRPVSDVTIGILRFSFSRRTCQGVFVVFRTTLSSFSRLLPLDQSLLVVPTLRTEFIADVTIGLRDSRKLVVTFCLLRLRALPCYDLHRSTSLLSFADVTVGLLFYLILE